MIALASEVRGCQRVGCGRMPHARGLCIIHYCEARTRATLSAEEAYDAWYVECADWPDFADWYQAAVDAAHLNNEPPPSLGDWCADATPAFCRQHRQKGWCARDARQG